jgi:hyperosmotically inducible protein
MKSKPARSPAQEREKAMNRRTRTSVLIVAGVLSAGLAQASPADAASTASQADLTGQVRQELAGLPYYGVFDLLTFQVSGNGVVTLGGGVVQGSLKQDAEKAVKDVTGVTEVQNKIEVLPASISDDQLRWALYRAIYRDSALARYGTPSSQAAAFRPGFFGWGQGYHGWGTFNQPRWADAPFYGMEPVGDYAIHIIVRNGQVTLAGVVDNQADKNLAGLRANGVFGAFSVTNDLHVASGPHA